MRTVLAAGAVVRDADGRFLLVQRANHARRRAAGRCPGGRVEPGESPAAAAAREVAEETGLDVAVGREWLVLEPPGRARRRCSRSTTSSPSRVGGTLRAGDDAADAGWFTPGELGAVAADHGPVRVPRGGRVRDAATHRGVAADDGR